MLLYIGTHTCSWVNAYDASAWRKTLQKPWSSHWQKRLDLGNQVQECRRWIQGGLGWQEDFQPILLGVHRIAGELPFVHCLYSYTTGWSSVHHGIVEALILFNEAAPSVRTGLSSIIDIIICECNFPIVLKTLWYHRYAESSCTQGKMLTHWINP